ncbi:hypothetical protein AAKU52_000379, partial [Pedobacter sp. CG_S7]
VTQTKANVYAIFNCVNIAPALRYHCVNIALTLIQPKGLPSVSYKKNIC